MSKNLIIKISDKEVYLDFTAIYTHSLSNQVGIQAFTLNHEPYCTLTTCINAQLAENETIIDTNNCFEALGTLIKAGIVEDTGREAESGFCTYPIVKILKKAA